MSPETMIGSLGVALLLLAFLLNLVRVLTTESYPYTALNFAGASLAGVASYLIGFMPFVVLEGNLGRRRGSRARSTDAGRPGDVKGNP